MWKHGSPSMWLIAVLKYSWIAVLKDSCLSRHTVDLWPDQCNEVRGCRFKSCQDQRLTLVSEQRAIYYNYIYSKRDSFPERANTSNHLLAWKISNLYSKFMCYNFKTLLLRNFTTFIFISNNQTLIDIHDYQAYLESWVEEIQCKGIVQFLFGDKRSFVHHIFLMVTTITQAL